MRNKWAKFSVILMVLIICGLVSIAAFFLITGSGPKAASTATPTTARSGPVTPTRATVQPTRAPSSPSNPQSGLTGFPNLPGFVPDLGPLQILTGLVGVAFDPMGFIRETLWEWFKIQLLAGLVIGIFMILNQTDPSIKLTAGWIFATAFGPGVVVGIISAYVVIGIISQLMKR